jgi:hypothetical protein
MTKLVDKMLALHKQKTSAQTNNTNTAIKETDTAIKETDAAINELVCELYNLTTPEIQLLQSKA